jgi:hypothetical protein
LFCLLQWLAPNQLLVEYFGAEIDSFEGGQLQKIILKVGFETIDIIGIIVMPC